jgi:hypothetical protein
VLEAAPTAGGMSALTIGSITASDTPWQEHAGIQDDHETHFADWSRAVERAAGRPALRPDLGRVLIERAPDALRQLAEYGLEIGGPNPEPLHHSVPRMHNLAGGGTAFLRLVAAAEARDIPLRTGQRALYLTRRAGRIAGVVTEEDGGGRLHHWPARRGVLLASAPNGVRERLAVLPDERTVEALAEPIYPYDRGDGQLMGLAAGGRLVAVEAGSRAQLRSVEQPYVEPHELLAQGGAWLNGRGEVIAAGRYEGSHIHAEGAATAASGRDVVEELLTQPDQHGYLVWGRALAEGMHRSTDGPDSPGRHDGWLASGKPPLCTVPTVGWAYYDDGPRLPGWHAGVTLSEALGRAGLPATSEAAVRARVGEGPYVVWGPFKPVLVMTRAGLAVDTRLRVLDAQDQPIPGLWAAGLAAYKDSTPGHGYGLCCGRRA